MSHEKPATHEKLCWSLGRTYVDAS
jgi:hypothetical protein